MKRNRDLHGNFEELSQAITDAIAKSPEVKRALKKIKNQNLLNMNTFLALLLKIETGRGERFEIEEKKVIKKRRAYLSKSAQYIDGMKLSNNEAAFEEYCAKKFNESEWLKRLKLKL